MKVMRNKTMVKKQAAAGGIGFIAAIAVVTVAEKFFNISSWFEPSADKEEQPAKPTA